MFFGANIGYDRLAACVRDIQGSCSVLKQLRCTTAGAGKRDETRPRTLQRPVAAGFVYHVELLPGENN